MRQVTYAMKFTGVGTEIEPGHLGARSAAPSASLVSDVGPEGVSFTLEPSGADDALFESEVKFASSTAFDEWGTITFGAGNRIHFKTIGEGYLGPSPDPDVQHGTVMWEVTGGEGAFEGATGLITSNFMVTASLEVTDNQFGVIWLP